MSLRLDREFLSAKLAREFPTGSPTLRLDREFLSAKLFTLITP